MVVKDGPYAVVRHPIYAAGLSAQILTGVCESLCIIFSMGTERNVSYR
jgi:protein-S-isoprenylcysteine O-methyltransferase Ste14